jgi:GAF domain-containing protein
MLSWIFSMLRKVMQYLSPRTGLKAQDLLGILNLQDQDLSTPSWLLKRVIQVVCQALKPNGCLIWLYEDPWHPDSSTPLWLGPGPRPNLLLADYETCPPWGMLLLSQLQDYRLRRALLKAGMRLAVPLIHQDELLGWLAVGPSGGDWQYSPDEQQFLEVLAYQTATAIKTIYLKSKLELSVTQLRLAYQQVIQAQ